MANRVSNRVRELRESRELSQIALATPVGLTRQSVHSVEAGRSVPAVDVALQIARALDCPVESLFGGSATDARLTTEPASEANLGRVALAHISGRWLCYSLNREEIGRSADAIAVRSKSGQVEVDVLRPTAESQVGLVVLAGDPKRISQVSHLARKGTRLVAREPGSGARRLLERELRRAGLSVDVARSATVVAPGHLQVAHAVAMGAGDVGIATRDAALAFGLTFMPLAEERYDLVVPRDELNDPRLARMFDVMTAAPLRRELSSLGHDMGPCGNRVAEIVET